MARFDNQVAIVTGGALGIGGETARRLAAEGARVIIADIDDQASKDNQTRIEQAGGEAITVHADMANASDIEHMVQVARDTCGRLDILVQNAWGVPVHSVRGSAVEVEEPGWDEGMAVMTKALFLGAKHAVPLMRATGGVIVNMASVHGLLMAARNLVYEAAKSAVIGMTRQMAIDFGPEGIRVNAICPGHIVTERAAARWDDYPDTVPFYENQYPLRRLGAPADIAAAVTFLASADASFITGHALVVDGGLSIQLQEDFGVQQARFARQHAFKFKGD